eukprot:TRINITY_DN57572_c0_g1_i1.p1 TRINITY_DN57572_c0_g1~~TRINITY_DN57572_c0_g1_i1.p1  ORF type:complete len:489 (+),score=67.83 TRINITY_DN57572_c0_g1_i1:2-1468(+)
MATLRSSVDQISAAEQRHIYPPLPSARFAAARRENTTAATQAAAARKKSGRGLGIIGATPPGGEARDGGVISAKTADLHGVGRVGVGVPSPLLSVREYPVPTGAFSFSRHSRAVSAKSAREYKPPRSKVGLEDVPSDNLPPMSHVLGAAISDSMKAGCWGLAAALADVLPGHVSDEDRGMVDDRTVEEGRDLNKIVDNMAPWPCPATAHMVRNDWTKLPGKPRGASVPTRSDAPLSLAWVACSDGARLKYARTTVVRGWERGLLWEHRLAGPLDDETGSRENDCWPMRFRQQWKQAFAVGPANAMKDLDTYGRRFEVSVEIVPQDREHYMHRLHQAPGMCQRPHLHLGVTALSLPPQRGGDDLEGRLEDPLSVFERCWMLSTNGHVYVGESVRCTVPVTWPVRPRPTSQASRSSVRVRLGLQVTESGSLRLTVDDDLGVPGSGELVAASTDDIVPRSYAREADALFPLVVIGPNIAGVTLRPVTMHGQ